MQGGKDASSGEMENGMSQETRIIEIVGPPGSGKSTLAASLRRALPHNRVENFPYYRRVRCLPFFLKNGLRLLPLLPTLPRGPHGSWLTARDMVSMLILHGWHHDLRGKSTHPPALLLLDEGAVTLLAWLRGFGSEYVRSQAVETWWQTMYMTWAQTLNLIIQLRIPTRDLLPRLRSRDRAWEIYSDAEALELLTKMAAAQEQAINTLAAIPHGPEILHIEAAGASPQTVLEEALKRLAPYAARV